MKLEEFCTILGKNVAAQPTVDAKLETAARFLCQVFSVKPDEVAVFGLDADGSSLRFLWPAQLKSSGSIPLSVANSLVAQTVREKRGSFDNSFATTPHASIFELFRTSSDSDRPMPIQKIVSVPMGRGDAVKGVVQVSRKGETQVAAGKDFTHNDLLIVQKAAEIMAQVI